MVPFKDMQPPHFVCDLLGSGTSRPLCLPMMWASFIMILIVSSIYFLLPSEYSGRDLWSSMWAERSERLLLAHRRRPTKVDAPFTTCHHYLMTSKTHRRKAHAASAFAYTISIFYLFCYTTVEHGVSQTATLAYYRRHFCRDFRIHYPQRISTAEFTGL